ncbi:MAG TPA: methionyl-tRNA formyltransferase [Clostridia bacterium]|jgi:methionyl-tRNA formyltransferase|nr:methionyl-tRNA formyltransferase [Clostridia bacterium]HHY05807.1 methionyl-tRNA formyltransferase [Clostridia bacterium]
MQIIFMGTPDFALPVLEKLAQTDHDLVAVVTQPDRVRGRGRKVSFSPVKKKALEMGLEVLQPCRVKEPDFIKTLQELKPDLIIVAAFGQILPEAILTLPKYGCLNVHASLLPRYRGAAPLQRALMAGEKKTGVTIMLMEQGLDTGDILTQAEVEIPVDYTFSQLHDHLANKGAELLIKTLPLWVAGEIVPRPQKEEESSYAPPLKKDDEKINWANSAEMIYHQIRGLVPEPGTYTIFRQKPLKIKGSEIYVCENQKAVPGTVLRLVKGQGFVVQTGQGTLLVKQVQPAGKKTMSAASFINGYHLEVGDVFNNPEK